MKNFRENIKKYQECSNFYKKHIKSKEYKEFYDLNKKESDENFKKYLEESDLDIRSREDFFDENSIGNIVFGDVLSNGGVGKLLKKLHALSKKKFKVKNYYKKPTIFSKYDYIHLQYTHHSTGVFAEIILLDDKYIDKIHISWSQINNYFAFFEYNFYFKRTLDNELFKEFVYNNVDVFTRKDFFNWFYLHDKLESNFRWLDDFESDLFPLICQHYITTYFYSEQGSNHQLLNIVSLIREKPFDIDKYHMFADVFFNKQYNYAVVKKDFDENNFLLLSGNNLIPNFSIMNFISRYGNEFYYKFFGYRELRVFEAEFSQYASGRKRITYNKKLKLLLNRMQGLTDGWSKFHGDLEKEFEENWDFYYSNKKEDFITFYEDYYEKIKEVYTKNFNYMKLLTVLNYAKSNKLISIIAVVISVIAIVLSLIL